MIRFLRSFVVIFGFLLFGIGACFIRYIIFPIKTYFIKDKTKKIEICADILNKSWKFFIDFLKFSKVLKIKTNDIEKLRNIKNSIIVSTHPSFIDVLILMSIIPKTTCFVAEKLSRNLFFKGMVDLLFILEGDNWVENAEKFLNNGFNLLIFPSGKRHREKESVRTHRGTAHIAKLTGKNIVAIKMFTDFDFLQINQPIYDAGNHPVTFNISYIKEINTNDYLNKYPDDITLKTKLTKEISGLLFN